MGFDGCVVWSAGPVRGYTESHDRWIWGFRVPSGRRHRALDLDLDRGVTFPRCSPLRPPPRSPARESSLRRPRDAPSAPSPRARVSTTMNCSRPRCVIDVASVRVGRTGDGCDDWIRARIASRASTRTVGGGGGPRARASHRVEVLMNFSELLITSSRKNWRRDARVRNMCGPSSPDSVA